MEFDFTRLERKDRSKLIISTIVPRPIGLVTTLGLDGGLNAAPFSFFNGMSSEPPLVVLGLETTPNFPNKDTGDNISAHGEFVVNLVSEDLAHQMNVTAIPFSAEVDEYAEAGLTAVPSTSVAPPRIAESPVAFECRCSHTLDVSPGNQIIVGEILTMHIKDQFIDLETMYVDTPALKLIGRMHGGGWYARTTDLFEMPRISVADWDKQKLEGAANE